MKNITISVSDDVYRRARIKAAERETSVTALVKEFLLALAEDESEFDRLAREEGDLRQRIENFRAADRLPRHQWHRPFNKKSRPEGRL